MLETAVAAVPTSTAAAAGGEGGSRRRVGLTAVEQFTYRPLFSLYSTKADKSSTVRLAASKAESASAFRRFWRWGSRPTYTIGQYFQL